MPPDRRGPPPGRPLVTDDDGDGPTVTEPERRYATPAAPAEVVGREAAAFEKGLAAGRAESWALTRELARDEWFADFRQALIAGGTLPPIAALLERRLRAFAAARGH